MGGVARTAVWEGWGSQESVALKPSRGRVGAGSPQLRQSGSQPFGVYPRQSEVENRHVKEITDTFTLVQVVDVIVVSRGWRETK